MWALEFDFELNLIEELEFVLDEINLPLYFQSKLYSTWILLFHCISSITFFQTHLRDNVDVLVTLGEAYYYNGDFPNAMSALERVCETKYHYCVQWSLVQECIFIVFFLWHFNYLYAFYQTENLIKHLIFLKRIVF